MEYNQFNSKMIKIGDTVYPIMDDYLTIGLPLRELSKEYTREDEPDRYPELNFRDISSAEGGQKSTSYLTHSLQKHPATFIPQIPRVLIRRYSDKGDYVLDSFSGSGTTGVEAVLNGRNYMGVEINPLSRLISDVSTTPLPPRIMDKFCDVVRDNIREVEPDEIGGFPGRTNKSYWFQEDTIDELNQIRGLISNFDYSQLSNYSGEIRKMMTLLLANTVFETSNSDSDVFKTYKSKRVKDKIESGEHPPSAIDTFLEEMEYVTDRISEFHKESDNNKVSSEVILGDSRGFNFEKKADLAITSPPYINAMNYYRDSKLRMFWIMDFLQHDIDPMELNKTIIGSNSSVSMRNKDGLPEKIREDGKIEGTRLGELDSKIESIYESEKNNSEKKAHLVRNFFMDDMVNSLANNYINLKEGGLFFFVVGENVILDEMIHTHKYVEDIAANLSNFSDDVDEDFEVIFTSFDSISSREMFESRKNVIDKEWVICLRK
jgi:DNA modification methylase